MAPFERIAALFSRPSVLSWQQKALCDRAAAEFLQRACASRAQPTSRKLIAKASVEEPKKPRTRS
eukprot:6181267-Pleurochrysis_carterae.AAC.1